MKFTAILYDKEALKYILAGKSIFTVEELCDGKLLDRNERFTYKVVKKGEVENNSLRWLVSVFTGTNNENHHHYTYMGVIKQNCDGTYYFIHSKSSSLTPTAPSSAFFSYYFKALVAGRPLMGKWYNFLRSDRCAVCGKLLTDPESIRLGIGAKCRERI